VERRGFLTMDLFGDGSEVGLERLVGRGEHLGTESAKEREEGREERCSAAS